ncbi:MAG: CocE/NonD family hydrolase [Deltaproteobacteria bacterium]|nr:CocE/NonD family hydrolase [Deltaproteobacteria bacterium]
MPTRHRRILCAALLALCGATPAVALDVQSGIGFVAITGEVEGTPLVLENAQHVDVQSGLVDRFGSLVFRDLGQGNAYFVREPGGATTAVTTRRFTDHPPQSFYQAQTLVEGLNYIETRDGTLLAAMVRAPLGSSFAPGRRFPTLVEYSGYAAADPDNPQPSTLIASAMGYATVAVNMRGSGCSGGVIDLFDLPTTADGYDVIEIVGNQDWVQGEGVGMIGISFPGISQMFVAGAQPPHLVAVAPFSIIGDIYRAPGFPGGIFNNGFAESWLQERADDALPAPEGGQAWAIQRVNDGDATCLANQSLRLQTQDPVDFTQSKPYYVSELMDARSPSNWAANIRVPTFISGAWQDEQTGSGFVTLLKQLPKRRDVKIMLVNGVHSSSMEPTSLWDWTAFLDIYVAKRFPNMDRLTPLAGAIYENILGPGAPTPPLPPDYLAGASDLADARRQFEAGPRVRVLMENGAGSGTPGLPAPRFELDFEKWPPPGARQTAWYFGPGGSLSKFKSVSDGFDSYDPDPEARPMQTIPGQGQAESWEIMPAYDWRPLVAGTAVAYATAPLEADTTIVGEGAVDLFLRSSASDTDIQVTLTEVRPDDLETYVQSGWLRASHRKLARKGNTRTEVRQTHLEADAEPLPPGQFTKMRVGIFAVAHTFRAGSRIRVSLEAPGGDRTRWAFDTFDTNGMVTNDVNYSRGYASRLVLPVVRRAPAPAGLPPCPGLRGQPCRAYEPASNGG